MTDLPLQPTALIMAIAVFVTVLLLAEGAYLLWQRRFGAEARRLEMRLQALADGRQRTQQNVLRQHEGAAGLVQGWLERTPLLHRLELLFRQADVSWRPASVLLTSLVSGFLVYAVMNVLLRQALALTLLLVLLVMLAPWLAVHWRRGRRFARLQSQLPEALDLMVRALRAGHAFSSSLQMVADEMPEPIAAEFRAVHDEVNYGVSLPLAFEHLVERVPLTDLRYFVVAVLIQREAGGNLTELLANLSRLIRARLKFMGRVRVLSSEGRLSGLILVIMPFALGGLLAVLNPDFMRPLWSDPMGIALVQWLCGLMVVGVLLMRKIVRIRV